jgi:uncharacterized SAM-binding protein YcdF (DUF218 family)
MESLLLPTPLHFLVFSALITAFAYRSHGPGLRRWRHVLLVTTAWIWVCSTTAFGDALYGALEGPVQDASRLGALRAEPDTLIVVLGSGVMRAPSGRPQPRMSVNGWERLHGAVALWRVTGGRLLFTGGPPDDPENSLAALAAGIAQEMGVPAAAIVRPMPLSGNTFEDLALARDLIAAHQGPKWLVTSALHMPRSLQVAQSLGLQLRPYPVDYRQISDLRWRAWLPDVGGYDRLAAVLHEALGWIWYALHYG